MTTSATLGAQRLDVVEIDLDRCDNVYGSSPCTASAPAGAECYNTIATCQDPANYASTSPLTLAFYTAGPPIQGQDGLPWVTDVSHQPTVQVVGDIAKRESVRITLQTASHPDTGGVDPYWETRMYDRARGDFFAKLLARNPFYVGRPLRWGRGYVGGSLVIRHYVIESIAGPDARGTVTIVAKDVLQLAEDRESKAPVPTDGTLVSLTTSPDRITLSTNDGYAVGETVALGSELISLDSFVSGTTYNVTRGARGTLEATHSVGDTVQKVEVLSGTPVEVITALLQEFTDIDTATYIPTAEWSALTTSGGPWENFALGGGTTGAGVIVKPTGVMTLIREILRDCSGRMWVDTENRKIRLSAQTGVEVPSVTLTDDDIMAPRRDVRARDQVTQVRFYYGRRDPFESTEEVDNYASQVITQAADLQASSRVGKVYERVIFSRWFDAAQLAIITLASQRIIDQYGPTPFTITLDLPPWNEQAEGELVTLESLIVQGVTGLPEPTRLLVTSAKFDDPQRGRYTLINAPGPTESIGDENTRVITTPTANLNVFDLFGMPSAAGTYTVIIPAGVTVYSTIPGQPALSTGGFDASDQDVVIEQTGDIIGIGGEGGDGGVATSIFVEGSGYTNISGNGGNGLPGGDAIEALCDLTIDNKGGNIWGGGGGGAGGDGVASNATAAGGDGGGGGGSFVATAGGDGGDAFVEAAPGDTPSETPGMPGQSGNIAGGGAGGGSRAGDGGAFGAAGGNGLDGQTGGSGGNAIEPNGNTITYKTVTNPANSAAALAEMQGDGRILGAVT
jgi:hypothetical protein